MAARDPEREYVALLSHLPLRRYTSSFVFLRDVLRIQGQLREARGLIGYSLRARPWSKQYWTLSVWESERALLDFVKAQPHAGVMASLRGRMGETGFVRWRLAGSEPLPTWDAAMARAQGQV
jgi:hypothetical protein